MRLILKINYIVSIGFKRADIRTRHARQCEHEQQPKPIRIRHVNEGFRYYFLYGGGTTKLLARPSPPPRITRRTILHHSPPRLLTRCSVQNYSNPFCIWSSSANSKRTMWSTVRYRRTIKSRTIAPTSSFSTLEWSVCVSVKSLLVSIGDFGSVLLYKKLRCFGFQMVVNRLWSILSRAKMIGSAKNRDKIHFMGCI